MTIGMLEGGLPVLASLLHENQAESPVSMILEEASTGSQLWPSSEDEAALSLRLGANVRWLFWW